MEEREGVIPREEIVFRFTAGGLREELMHIAQQQIKEQGFAKLKSNAEGLPRIFFRNRMCYYVGLRAVSEDSEILEDWEISLRVAILATYFEKDLERATLEQVLVAWLTTDPNWLWPEQPAEINKQIKGYGLVHKFYKPCLHMAAFALGYTVESEKLTMDPSWPTAARSYAEKRTRQMIRHLQQGPQD